MIIVTTITVIIALLRLLPMALVSTLNRGYADCQVIAQSLCLSMGVPKYNKSRVELYLNRYYDSSYYN